MPAPPPRSFVLLAAVLGCALLSGCATPVAGTARSDAPPADGSPYVLVLGTAQDAGKPQIGCRDACCEAARRDPALRRLASSLLVADPASGGRWLLDASPDLREQMDRAVGHPPTRDLPGPRPPLVDGVYLTHVHMGHFAGLLHLGPEAYSARQLPVFGTARLRSFLADNEPWRFLVTQGHFDLRSFEPGAPHAPTGPDGRPVDGLTIEAFRVPHRDELSDTVGFLVRGPRRTLAYLPDVDAWERWDLPLEDFLAGVDLALVDGTFYADGEVPGRDLSEIPHPFISRTVERLADAPPELRAKVRFLHLNHGNPAGDPDSAAAAAVRAAGMAVVREGEVFAL